ncbi:MAG: bifunctional pyr operon transcriptional regulator/uracil phosphoribosyltransferase PyrR [Candidatus Thiothrix putei]|uniref:Bifunctional pyr operon transcriptional regulator/uracil phosphoribosyltransferase PyrR n=1 Tax=Candidatus Thiothrix putei TaxID=3080811 RepID=A0AA95HE96_9GAMM|nr:MAG: bifunctional pyr operon transcriptional regulator/uracil phosphoribosyltransferase PyrR [Candidatus Thiothrix putei]
MDSKSYNINALLDQLEQQIRAWMQAKSITNPVIVGLHTAGVWVAQALRQRLHIAEELGTVSATFYRDDFHQVGLHRQQKPSHLPFEIENRHVLLVDDVIYTGRTLRGAMNELFDFGRPASITAIVLIAREGRELPIEPQIVALREEPGSHFRYQVTGPEPLTLQLVAS